MVRVRECEAPAELIDRFREGEAPAELKEESLMMMFVQVFWLPKEGNTIEEYEDALAYSISERRFAVADGATESSFAERWAQSLVRGFVFGEVPPWEGEAPAEPIDKFGGSLTLPVPIDKFRSLTLPALKNWLEPLQREWREGIDWKRLPWFAVEKAQAGAFASLLGLEFVGCSAGASPSHSAGASPSLSSSETPATESLRWRAIAIGDSCLFQVRNDALFRAFPLDRAEQFGNRPLLLSSNPVNNQRVWDEVQFDEGDCQIDDIFFLVTDALAHWFLVQHEAGAKPWATLCDLNTQEDFDSLIVHLRQERLIRNDDVTLIIIHLDCNALSSGQRNYEEKQ